MLARNFKKANVQILSIRVAIDFNCLIELGSLCKNAMPVCLQADSVVVDAAARVSQDLNVWIAQC